MGLDRHAQEERIRPARWHRQNRALLRPPLGGWFARSAIAKDDVPDFVFLAHRTAAHTLTEQSPDGRALREALLPMLGASGEWTFQAGVRPTVTLPAIPLPPWLAGHTLFLSLRYSSNTTEPIRAWVAFRRGGRPLSTLVFKPYFFPQSSEDFFFLTVPRDADSVRIQLRVSPMTSRITLDSFRLFIDAPASQSPL